MAFGFFNQPEDISKLPSFTPEQQQLFSQLGQRTSQELASAPSLSFEPIRERSMRDFQSKLLPSLFGQLLGRGQSDFTGADLRSITQSGLANFGQDLAAQESQYNLSRNQALMQLLQQALQPAFQYHIKPEQQGLMSTLLPLAGTAAGAFLGGPGGAALGGALANALGVSAEMMAASGNKGSQDRMGGVYGR